VVYNGQHFASKLEWQYYMRLELLKKAGEVVFFLRQVPFHLPGGVKYVTDFVVFYANGEVRFIDIKGMETAQFKAKLKMVEALYPVTIDAIKRGDFK